MPQPVIHGMSKTPEYRVWSRIRQRCHNKKHDSYKNYGGRGITVCDKWNNNFIAFFLDMGKRPSDKHSIDRIDNDLGYFPNNCRWATKRQQDNNRRDNRRINTPNGIMTLANAERSFGICQDVLSARIRLGWKEEDLLLPLNSKSNRDA